MDKVIKPLKKKKLGLIATMAALVPGLVIATAKSSYDAQDAAVRR
jgi:hypothetical protein